MTKRNLGSPFLLKCIRGALFTAIAVLAVATLRADQVVLKNGDRVTGSIVKKDGNALTIDSSHFGIITMPWDEVESVTADTPLNVVLSGDQTVRATLQTRAGQIEVAVPDAPRSIAAAELVALRNDAEQEAYERLLRPGLLDLWTVDGSLGFAGAKGNAETGTLTTPINFARVSNTSATTAYFNSIRSTATIDGVSSQTANAVRGGWGYSRDLTSRMFLNTFNDYEYDKFQSLDLRVVLGTGVGYHVWQSDKGWLDVVGGGAWNRETFSPDPDPSFTRNSAEAYWGNNLGFKLNSRTSLTQGFRMFNNLSNSGEYRMNFDLGATTALTDWLNWNVALSDRYLSNPAPGRKTNDVLYSTGLGFSFGR
jgi:putative salt-induced outer membrane protein